MLHMGQLSLNARMAFHSLQKLCSGQFIPGSSNQCGIGIMLSQQRHSRIQFCLSDGIGTGEDDGRSSFNLIVVELAKVLHINLNLAGIGNSDLIAQHHISTGHLLHSRYNIAELANTGGFDNDSLGSILSNHLFQGLAKITHKAAANAAGIHLRDVDAGILQETAINTDLAKFIFDQHQFLTGIGLLDHLLDQRGLTSAQETGININFCHGIFSFICFSFILSQSFQYFHPFRKKTPLHKAEVFLKSKIRQQPSRK